MNKDFETKVKKFFKEFNAQKSVVKLKRLDNTGCHFEVIFNLNKDKYIETEIYEKGRAIIYLNENFYKNIKNLSVKYFNKTINWNNTYTIGHIDVI